MPRRDRSFTNEDIIRFYCRNLDQDERMGVLVALATGPCEDNNESLCTWLDRITSILDKMCDMVALVPPKVMRNARLKIFFEAMTAICMLNSRLKAVHGILCE